MAGDNVLIGHCKRAACAWFEDGTSPAFRHSADTYGACRSLRCDFERAGSPFRPRVESDCDVRSDSYESAPGPDDPSTPTWLGGRGRFRQLNTAGLPLSPQRLYGFYDREPAAGCAANFMSGLCPSAFGLTTKINSLNHFIFSTELSTASAVAKRAEITGDLVFKARSLRKYRGGASGCGKQYRLICR